MLFRRFKRRFRGVSEGCRYLHGCTQNAKTPLISSKPYSILLRSPETYGNPLKCPWSTSDFLECFWDSMKLLEQINSNLLYITPWWKISKPYRLYNVHESTWNFLDPPWNSLWLSETPMKSPKTHWNILEMPLNPSETPWNSHETLPDIFRRL